MIHFFYVLWSWITTIIFAIIFLLALFIGDVCLRIAFLFGYRASQNTIHTLMWVIIQTLKIIGTRIRFNPARCMLEHNRPLIVVSNHQSMFDIPCEFWYFRKFHVKFVAKKELAKGAPSASFHLRNGFHAIIDRKDGNQAVKAITDMAIRAEERKFAALIYPEGSRSRDGKLKEFKLRGLATLLENMPSALVVPMAVDGSWQLVPRKYGYIPFGLRYEMTMLEPIEPNGLTPETVLAMCEAQIRTKIGQESLKTS